MNSLVKVQVASQIEFLLRHKAAAAKNESLRLEVIAHAKERKEAAMKRLEQLEIERAQKEAEQHQRFEEQHKRMQVVRQNRDEQDRLAREHTQKRMEVHSQRYTAVQEERAKELEEAAEVHRLKEEGKRFAEERTKRVQEYNKQCLINKIEHEKQRLEKMNEEVEAIKRKRNEEQKRMNHDKKKLQAAMNDFMRTGIWKMPEGVEMSAIPKSMLLFFGTSATDPFAPFPCPSFFAGSDSLLGEPDEELKILSLTDRMPEAPLLECNVATKGTVQKDEYAYFKVRVEGKQSVVKVKLASLHGDPDVSASFTLFRTQKMSFFLIIALQLYVGNGRCPRPDKTNSTWKKSGHGDDVVTIYYFDARFAPGFLYIGVHGATLAEFSLKVVWKDVDIVQAGNMPSPGPSRLSNGTPSLGEKKDAPRSENGQPVLPKILNPTKGEDASHPAHPNVAAGCHSLLF